jgi:aryl-alcohol dehydrogenase-like predicted oxidoreductase
MGDESADRTGQMDRRDFLGKGAGAFAASAALGDDKVAAPRPRVRRRRRVGGGVYLDPQAVGPGGAAGPGEGGQDGNGAGANQGQAAELPRRKLGKTGVDVTMLTLGTWLSPGGERLLRFAWANGVRYVDTADNYGSEPMIARWMQAAGVPRKELFLVTKTSPQAPQQLLGMLDDRLEALQTDYVDAILIHAMGDASFDAQVNWPRSPEFKATAEAIRRSGKARFVGFSTHHPRRAELLMSAAAGGFVDMIMLQNNPWIAQDDAMNRALDAAAKAGIGLVSMKQVAGNMNLDEVAWNLPELAAKGLTPYQALLHAIWSDGRFSSVCVSMRNTDQIRENAAAAQTFQPMKRAAIDRLRDACIAARPTMCASCDGRCCRAAGTTAELGNLTRFLTYHDHHGHRAEARWPWWS